MEARAGGCATVRHDRLSIRRRRQPHRQRPPAVHLRATNRLTRVTDATGTTAKTLIAHEHRDHGHDHDHDWPLDRDDGHDAHRDHGCQERNAHSAHWGWPFKGHDAASAHSGSRLFDYSQWRLLGEYTPDGRPVEETVWLGNRPVATVRDHRLYYIHTDHLGTPRVITEPGSGKVVWQWRSGPFGTGQPNEDPSGTGRKFVYNLRFAGSITTAKPGRPITDFRIMIRG